MTGSQCDCTGGKCLCVVIGPVMEKSCSCGRPEQVQPSFNIGAFSATSGTTPRWITNVLSRLPTFWLKGVEAGPLQAWIIALVVLSWAFRLVYASKFLGDESSAWFYLSNDEQPVDTVETMNRE